MEDSTKELNILIVGVGGQGVILLSELLGKAAVADGINVRGSEVLGMAVRGGSVTSAIRLGSNVHGPLIPMGKCDVIVGMEPAEALRHAANLSQTGTVVLNTHKVIPFTATLGEREYPSLETIVEKIKSVAGKVKSLDAAALAGEAGSRQAANIVMLGALFATDIMPIRQSTIKKALSERFSVKLAPANLKAFTIGYEHCQQALI